MGHWNAAMTNEPIIKVEPGAQSLSIDEADAMRAAVEEIGDVEVARLVGISRHALARSIARLSVHSGTATACRLFLHSRRKLAA